MARLFTRSLSECKVPTSWKTSKTVLPCKKGNPVDIGTYRPICCCLIARVQNAFIVLKKAFDTVETEAVIEALGNQGVPTQYIRMLRELYDNFTTRISPFYKKVIVNVRRGVRQGDTISPKLSSAALENIMRHSEWEDSGVEVNGRYPHHLRFAEDIIFITPNIEQAERMLAEFDNGCGMIGLRLNLTNTMFVKTNWYLIVGGRLVLSQRMPNKEDTLLGCKPCWVAAARNEQNSHLLTVVPLLGLIAALTIHFGHLTLPSRLIE
ncbi:unnamed protein product [Haemonchus placei]|uniref:Reverse transcriptase domain-containing protein n=1 Tax=Haemonchus placei TaxID=6290 RepID=A0A3P8ASN2_HAEPC|nr:unnamed protein product [Haemonchus placei]